MKCPKLPTSSTQQGKACERPGREGLIGVEHESIVESNGPRGNAVVDDANTRVSARSHCRRYHICGLFPTTCNRFQFRRPQPRLSWQLKKQSPKFRPPKRRIATPSSETWNPK